MKNSWLMFLLAFMVGCGDGAPIKGGSDAGPDAEMDMGSDLEEDMEADLPVIEGDAYLGIGAPFEEFTPNQEIELVSGFQGGWHIDVNLLTDARLAQSTLASELEAHARSANGDDMFTTILELDPSYWVQTDDGWLLVIPSLAMDVFEYPTDWVDQPFTLDVTVTLGNGQMLSVTIDLILVDDVDEFETG